MAAVLERTWRDCEDLSPSGWQADDERAAWRAHPTSRSGAERRDPVVRLSHRGGVADGLPPKLKHIGDAIENSRTILDIQPDEDLGVVKYSEATWERAVNFVRKNAEWLLNSFGCVIDAPQILPGPDGSIDIHWDRPTFEMLINIPADSRAQAGFYGDDRGEIAIKGSVDPSRFNHGLLLWLLRIA